MPFYMYQMSYSRDAIKAMLAKPTDRKAAARQVVEATGGKLLEFFCFGSDDVVVIAEAPSDAAMAACRWRSPPPGRPPTGRSRS